MLMANNSFIRNETVIAPKLPQTGLAFTLLIQKLRCERGIPEFGMGAAALILCMLSLITGLRTGKDKKDQKSRMTMNHVR